MVCCCCTRVENEAKVSNTFEDMEMQVRQQQRDERKKRLRVGPRTASNMFRDARLVDNKKKASKELSSSN